MARTLNDIKQAIKISFTANETLAQSYGFATGADFDTEFSKVSFEKMLIDVMAFTTWTLESIFDVHAQEVSDQIANLKPHSLRWYRSKARAFQFGYGLIEDSDQYDNTGLTDEQINASQIIKYCAVNEAVNESRLIIKIATEDANNNLEPINAEQLTAFKEYLSEVKDAGNTITVTNYLPDLLYLNMVIYYDPLIFAPDGSLLLDGTRPVELAINTFLTNLPFNGVLQLVKLVDALQQVEGVEIPHLVSASSSWINPTSGGYGNAEVINVYKIPESGYFKPNNFSNITYQPYG